MSISLLAVHGNGGGGDRFGWFAPDTPANRVDSVLNAYAGCAAFAQQFEIITAEWWRSLPTLATPATVLWGAEERVLSADMADDLRQVLPDADIRTVPGWDHFPMTDTPQEYADVVVQAARQLLSRSGHAS